MYSAWPYVSLDHETCLKCQFFKIEIYTSSENWINMLYIDVYFAKIQLLENLESEGAKQSKYWEMPLKLSKWCS